MSVINQMLKDLDQRRNDVPVYQASSATVNYPSAQTFGPHKIILLIGLIVFVMLLTVAVIYQLGLFNQAPSQLPHQVAEDENLTKSVIQVETDKSTEKNTRIETQNDNHEKAPTNAVSENSQATVIPQRVETLVENKTVSSNQLKPSIIKSKPKLSLAAQSKIRYQQAMAENKSADVSSAKQSLIASLELNDNNHQARILLLSIWLAENQIIQMKEMLNVALNQWPDVHQYRQIKARLLMQTQQQQQALTLLQSVIPDVHKATNYHALLAFVAQKLAKHQIASNHFQLLLSVNNSRADWWLGLAVSEENLAHHQIALEAYRKSLEKGGLAESVKQYAEQRITVIQGY